MDLSWWRYIANRKSPRYDNLFRLPSTRIDLVKSFFKGITEYSGDPMQPDVYKNALLNLEPGLVYPAAAGFFNASMRITLDGGLTVDIPTHELQRYLRGLDPDGNTVLNTGYTELQVYGEPAPQDASVLGKAFLSQVSAGCLGNCFGLMINT
jgi:hypothetical protein